MLTTPLSNTFYQIRFLQKIIACASLLAASLLWCASLVSCSQEGDDNGIAANVGTQFTLLVHTYNVNGKTFILPKEEMDLLCTSLNERAKNLDIPGFLTKPLKDNKILAVFESTNKELCETYIETILSDGVDIMFLPVHPENDRLIAESVEHIPGWQPFEYDYQDDNGVSHQEKLFLSKQVELTGKDIKAAYVDYSRTGYVSITLNNEGGEKMQRITSAMTKGRDRLAIVFDGRVVSAPVVQSNLSKDFGISGLDGPGETQQFVNRLSNIIPYTLEIIDGQAPDPNRQPAP